jgi:Spy/CpxP family protein refolding chaperone
MVVQTQPAGPPDGRGLKGRRELHQQLNLSEDQETKMHRLSLALQRKQNELRSKIQMARIDIREFYLADKIDRSALEKLIKQVSDAQHQVKLNVVDFWFSVNDILNPEQQKVWKRHVGQMAEQFGDQAHRFSKRLYRPHRMPEGPPLMDEDND